MEIQYVDVILPRATSEQAVRTACTVENFSSSMTLCPSSKPSSWDKNRDKKKNNQPKKYNQKDKVSSQND